MKEVDSTKDKMVKKTSEIHQREIKTFDEISRPKDAEGPRTFDDIAKQRESKDIKTFDDIAKHKEKVDSSKSIEKPGEIKKYNDGDTLQEFRDKNNQPVRLEIWHDKGDYFEIQPYRNTEQIGHAKVNINATDHRAYIADIHIFNEKEQRMGIGSNVLKECENLCRERKVTRIEGDIAPDYDYEKIRKFYEKNGYTVKGMHLWKDLE